MDPGCSAVQILQALPAEPAFALGRRCSLVCGCLDYLGSSLVGLLDGKLVDLGQSGSSLQTALDSSCCFSSGQLALRK